MIYSDAEAKHLVSQELFVKKMNEVAAAMSGGGGGGNDDYVVAFAVTLAGEQSTGTCNRTYAEIAAALKAEKNIKCVLDFAETVDIPAFTTITKSYSYAPQTGFMVSCSLLYGNNLIFFIQIAVTATNNVVVQMKGVA